MWVECCTIKRVLYYNNNYYAWHCILNFDSLMFNRSSDLFKAKFDQVWTPFISFSDFFFLRLAETIKNVRNYFYAKTKYMQFLAHRDWTLLLNHFYKELKNVVKKINIIIYVVILNRILFVLKWQNLKLKT